MRKFPRPGRNGQVVSNFHNLLVIDTNVVVSALLKADSFPAAVLRSVLNGDALMAHDSRILLEYREVLARPKFGFSPVLAEHLLRYLEDVGIVVAASPLRVSLPDPDDTKFLEVCTAAGPDARLVTGNIRQFPVEARHDVHVVTPREWFEQLP